uniref:MAK10-like protein n=1 Tax=Tanacetum cinerariifolium TaxID=118510 RepID=A0A6L2J588_TANCI|nr:MAK10-like protein [Tanacetum cinerariifolium]
MSQGSDTYDSQISHTLDPSNVFGGSMGGAGTTFVIFTWNGQDYNPTPKWFQDLLTKPGDGVVVPSDAVRSYKRLHQISYDGEENPIRTLGDYSRPSHEGYRNTTELPDGKNMVPLRSDTILLVQIGCSFDEFRSEDPNQHFKNFIKLVDSLDLDVANRERTRLQDLALYDNESWNDPKDFTKPIKAISFPQDVPSTSDCRLIELENQVQHPMKAHLSPKSSVQVNKISSSCEICSSPHDTQYCMENLKQAFVYYTSSLTDEVGGTIGSDAAKDISRDTIINVEKKLKEGLDGSKTVIGEDEPRDIKQNKLDDIMCGEMKEVDEVEMESEELEEEIE